MIVVVENRDAAVAEHSVRAEPGELRIEGTEVLRRLGEPLRDRGERGAGLTNVEDGAEVSFERPEIVLSREIAAGDFADEKEVLLAEIGRELLDSAAEIAGLLDRDVLQGVDPEAVAVGERNPVFVALREMRQRAGVIEREVTQVLEVAALVLGVGVERIARAEAAGARARIGFEVLQLGRPDPVLGPTDTFRPRRAVRTAPGAEGLMAARVVGLVFAARRALRVEPVRSRVVEDDIEDDAQPAPMRLADELHEIVARPEPRIDLEEVLDAIAVVGVEMAALLEHGAEPDRGRAEVAQVVKLRGDAGDGAALPAAAPGPHPAVPAPARSGGSGRPGRRAVVAVEQRTRSLPAVAEAVDEEEVEHVVAPIDWRRMTALAPGQLQAGERIRPRLLKGIGHERHGDLRWFAPAPGGRGGWRPRGASAANKTYRPLLHVYGTRRVAPCPLCPGGVNRRRSQNPAAGMPPGDNRAASLLRSGLRQGHRAFV